MTLRAARDRARAFELTPAVVARTARLVKEMRLRVILDLNQITASPDLYN
jgi:hypothetical protein